MKHICIGIFHDEALGSLLGKKGTDSDLLLFHRKIDDVVYTFIAARDDRIQTKTQMLSMIDAAIISCNTITSSVGETILLLDMFQISHGVCLVQPFSETEAFLQQLSKDTCVESYFFTDQRSMRILDYFHNLDPKRSLNGAPVVSIDHAFPVKGVGDICLGTINQGMVHRYDSLLLFPLDKPVVIRSLQVQDVDVAEAVAGSRIGCAIKGATWEEMKRGYILSTSGAVQTTNTIKMTFVKNLFYPDIPKEQQSFHLTIGLQTIPVKITQSSNDYLEIQTEKPVVLKEDDIGVLLNLNAPKLHLVGKGTVL